MFIYVIVCSETLKIYVGQHKGGNLKHYLQQKYWDAHYYPGVRSRIYASMRIHPRETWSIHPLVSGVQTRAELDKLEKHFIRVLKSQHPDVGYNICDGGEGFTGRHTKSARKKISRAMKKVMIGNQNGRGNIGKKNPKSAEWRRRVSATLTGRKKSAIHARHIREGRRGIIPQWSVESRARMTEGTKRGCHIRWHVQRGVIKIGCAFCVERENGK